MSDALNNEAVVSDVEAKEVAARDRANVERAAAKKRVYTHPLRKKYESLAAQCTDAVERGDKPAAAKLMSEKKQAFAAWWNATAEDRKTSKLNR